MQAMLIPASGGGKPLRLEKDVTVVGRRRWVCDVYFDDPTISKFHCLIMHSRSNIYYVRDLGSANGTLVNGRKVTEEAIVHGDELSFANLNYKFHVLATAGESGTASGEIAAAAAAAAAATAGDQTMPESADKLGSQKTIDQSDAEGLSGLARAAADSGDVEATILSSDSDVRRIIE